MHEELTFFHGQNKTQSSNKTKTIFLLDSVLFPHCKKIPNGTLCCYCTFCGLLFAAASAELF